MHHVHCMYTCTCTCTCLFSLHVYPEEFDPPLHSQYSLPSVLPEHSPPFFTRPSTGDALVLWHGRVHGTRDHQRGRGRARHDRGLVESWGTALWAANLRVSICPIWGRQLTERSIEVSPLVQRGLVVSYPDPSFTWNEGGAWGWD